MGCIATYGLHLPSSASASFPARRSSPSKLKLKLASFGATHDDDEDNDSCSPILAGLPSKHLGLTKSRAYERLPLSLCNRRVYEYMKSGRVEDAREVFDGMRERDINSWGHIIAGYAQNRCGAQSLELFCFLHENGTQLSELIITGAVRACSSLNNIEHGKQVHAFIIKARAGFDSGVGVGTALLTMYAKLGCIDDARKVFDKMSKPNHVSFTAMIGGYARSHRLHHALRLFCELESELKSKANQFTFSNLLSVVSDLGTLQEGRQLHAHVIKTGFDSDVGVGNGVLTMYVKCGCIDDAFRVFDEMATPNVVAWTAMIGGLVQNKYTHEALKLFSSMIRFKISDIYHDVLIPRRTLPSMESLSESEEVKPNEFTFSTVLSACSTQAALAEGKQIHAQILRSGLHSHVNLGAALITMYASCGITHHAESVFERMTERNVVSWTAMIAGYAQNGQYEEALKCFRKMQEEGLRPNQFTFSSVLSASANLGILGQGKQLHACLVKTRFRSNVSAGNALVTMYAKCGSIDDAHYAFDELGDRDLISWNAMIGGYAQHGNGEKALEIFEQMQQRGIKPDHITFVGVLSACSNVGLVDKGRYYFGAMTQQYGITPTLEHYTCMIDVFGRAGFLDAAEKVIKKMPFKADVKVWRSLLSACKIHSDIKLAEHAAECILSLDTKIASTYMLLSNIYAANERWESVENFQILMKDRNVQREPGRSWIEVQKSVHVFISKDTSHPQTDEIYAKLEELTQKMRDKGYVSTTKLLWYDVEEDLKEKFICYHSERLAIAFGLISTSYEMPIRVVKNLRVCSDCHAFIKLISKIVGRVLVVRDTNRFHHFKDGLCSCDDYW